ncbi:MAG TPA: long-chain fatty acid--CoA ligase [Bdellovibrionales bacterium]|nr:long-chain fatty acid--CoA ligase [Bdellovibrionales bacterium]
MADTILNSIEVAKKRGGTAVRYVKNGKWTDMSWSEYVTQIEQIAAGLTTLGVKENTKVAVLSNTRVEWAVADLAILGLGAVTVPIYPSSLPEDAKFILNDSESTVLICENRAMVDKWKLIADKCPGVKHIVTMEPVKDPDVTVIEWNEIKSRGQKKLADTPDLYDKARKKVTLDQTATIVYTSGTTGVPKGVVLIHRCIISEVQEVFELVKIDESDTSLTFLPYSHILGRVELWGHIFLGFTQGYAENIDRIRVNLGDVKPTFLVAVPRIFEKIYNGIISQAEASPVKHKIFKWALEIGREVSAAKIAKKQLSIQALLKYRVAKKLVFDKLAQRLGGRVRFAFSGGAPLSREIAEFFHAANLLVLEGYGLTETTAAVTFNNPFDYRFGTVGKAVGDVQIKIASDGEILIRSDKVMKEYYKNPEATAEVLVDGWFYTGDIGELDSDGFLRITDRKKDLIKTAGGKFVAPQKLENLLKLNKYVSSVLIHGDKRKYIVALITLNADNVMAYARERGIEFNSIKDLSQNPQIQALIREAVAEANNGLASYESIKNFSILPSDFAVDTGELTPSLKVKRKFCDQKYKENLDRLYGPE